MKRSASQTQTILVQTVLYLIITIEKKNQSYKKSQSVTVVIQGLIKKNMCASQDDSDRNFPIDNVKEQCIHNNNTAISTVLNDTIVLLYIK